MTDSADDPPPSAPPVWQRRLFVSFPRLLTAILILVGIAINFANVVSRYLFDFALYWAEEIMVFVVVWCVFIGAVAVAFNGAHLKMDLFSARLPSPWKEAVNGLTALLLVVCGVFVALQSWKTIRLFSESGDVSVTASVPMVVPHAALLIGMAATVVAVLLRFGAYVRNRFPERE